MKKAIAAAVIAAEMCQSVWAAESVVFDLGGVVKAMHEIEKFTGLSARQWKLSTKEKHKEPQIMLLYHAPHVLSDFASVPEMKGWASDSADELNKKLADAGSPIRLEDWGKNGYGAVTSLDYAAQFTETGFYAEKQGGRVVPVTLLGKPAFKLTTETHGVEFVAVKGASPIVIVPMKNGDALLFQRSDDRPADGFALHKRASQLIRASQGRTDRTIVGVTVPMVNLNQEADISWMIGMKLNEDVLAQAKQNVRFFLDPNGAVVKTETALGMKRMVSAPIHIELDGPFMAVVTRPGIDRPIFAGYIVPDSFGAPPTWKKRP